jgi:hypothetical protein
MNAAALSSSVSAIASVVGDLSVPGWQPGFLKLLPYIRRDIQIAFRELHGDARDEAVQEAICNACLAYARLARQGRPQVATAGSLARFAVAQYWAGRRVGSPLNVKDVTSAYCQAHSDVRMESLSTQDPHSGDWREILIEDRRITPADLAASRIDYPAFLASLTPRHRRIAQVLATGETTKRAAKRFRVSSARISQLRQWFKSAWEQFHAPKREALAAA